MFRTHPRRARSVPIPIVVLTLAVAAVSCGGDDTDSGSAADAGADQASGQDGVTIVFESYNYGTQGLGGEGTQHLIDEFEAAHPDIQVEPVGTPVAEIHTSVETKIAAGEPPDVVQIGWSKFAFVLENLPYVPYGELAPEAEVEEHLAGMSPELAALGERDGKLVGLPYTVSTPTLIVNADLFEQAGLDVDDLPTTWSEAEEAALEIVDTGAQGIYVDAATESKSDFLTQSLVNSNGGAVMDDDGNPTFDEPEAVEALSMLADLTASGAQPPVSESEALALFQAGQLGMMVTSTALLVDLVGSVDFEVATAGIPAYGDTPVRPTVSGAGLFVFSEDQAKRAAAWELVKFLTGDEGGTIVTSEIGYLPLRPALVDDPDGLAPYFAEDSRLMPAVEQLEQVVPYQVFPGPDGTRATQTLQDEAVAPIMLNGADPEATLSSVADGVRDLLDP